MGLVAMDGIVNKDETCKQKPFIKLRELQTMCLIESLVGATSF